MPALSAGLDMLAPPPTVRSFLSYLPAHILEFAGQSSSFVTVFNRNGKVVHNLQDTGNAFHYITGVTLCGNQLYLGSLRTDAIEVMPIPGSPWINRNQLAKRASPPCPILLRLAVIFKIRKILYDARLKHADCNRSDRVRHVIRFMA